MDRNREARKSTMAASANGLSRRRHRSNSLRDSPEDDGGGMELTEAATARLRDRGGKKERDRERLSRSSRKRRGVGGDRVGEESSEESVNDEEEDDYDDERGVGGGVRMYPPPSSSNQTTAALGNNNTNNHSSSQYVNRKSFPPSVVTTANVVRPGWKPADQVIGFTVPRKARSASGKRPPECSISGSGVGTEQINRQTSTSPVRLTPSPAPVSPPSSSNASVRKKLKPNNNINGSKPRPPKSASKPASSNPEELEIEIAEVLYGMMTQSHTTPTSSKKDVVVGSDSASLDAREMNNKSRVSSPISNSTSQLPQNSSSSAGPLSAVAPKRKRPRQVSDSFSVRQSSIPLTAKVEVDLPPKKEMSSTNLGSAAENGVVPLDVASSQVGLPPSELPDSSRDVVPAKDEAVTSPKKESPAVRADNDREIATVTKADSSISAFESQREEKFEIDLMAPPPPQMRSSPEREGEINFGAVSEQKPLTRNKEGETAVKSGREDAANMEPEQKRAKVTAEEGNLERKPVVINKEIKINFHGLDLEKEWDVKLNPDAQKTQQQQQQQPKPVKDEQPHSEKIAQSGSVPLPMSVGSWPGGLPQMGTYMAAPLRGVVSMDGNTVSPAPVQPPFSHPRPKRCATHFYIARNIHYLQQFMKMNPFWPPAAGSAASLFGAKPCNLNLMPSAELQGNNAGKMLNSVQEKGQGQPIFLTHSVKDKGSQANNIADMQRKQPQIMLQQALPPGAPSNMLHGPAFIFPLNQQQAAAAAAASIRPGSVKPPASSGNVAASPASTSASVSGSTTAPPAATAVTFNYPNMPTNETQFLAILQNNPYPFPIPSVGAPPTYRGTQAQAMPFFNGSFYSSQMMHPAQLQQQQQQQSTQQQNTSSGSSSSQKHLHNQQQQQRPQGSSGNNLHNFPAPKKTNQHMPNAEVGGEDSPSTADSRASRASKGVYGQNIAAMSMPIHSQNFAMMNPAPPLSVFGGAASGGGNQGEKKQQHQQSSYRFLGLPDSTRHGIPMMVATAGTQAGHQKKNFCVSEEAKPASTIGDSSTNLDEEKKNSMVKPSSTVGHQSIVFSIDAPDAISSASLRAARTSSTPNPMANANGSPNSPHPAQLQFQQHQHQQQLMQHLQKQQQQQAAAARSKTPSTSNVSVYSDHLASSGKYDAKFPNGISNFQQNLVQNSSSSSSQSQQWKNSVKTASQVTSTMSSPKNPPQQQNRTPHSQTQISFGGTQKQATPPPSQGQAAATSHQAPSPPIHGSPTTSSISKGASGSPRTTTTPASATSRSAQPSAMSSQPPKNSSSAGSRNVSSVLSSSHVTSFSNTSAKPQMQQLQPQQMLFSHFMPTQAANQFYNYSQRRILEPSKPVSLAASSSTGMLSLSSPATGSNSSTSDAKAVAASTTSAAVSNLKGGVSPSQGILHSAVPPGFNYVHAVPTAGQVKPAEQKQPAGNRESLSRK